MEGLTARTLAAAFVFAAALAAAQGRVGESLDELRKRYGRPADMPTPNPVIWLFEAGDGQLALSVTLDDEKKSIAEGLRPIGRAILTAKFAEDFIALQLGKLAFSETRRTLKPGETCEFGGKTFTCGKDEVLVVDEPNDILIVWNRGANPLVMAVSAAMVRKG